MARRRARCTPLLTESSSAGDIFSTYTVGKDVLSKWAILECSPEVSVLLISVTLLLVFLLAAQPDVVGAQLFISFMFLTSRCFGKLPTERGLVK